MTVQITIIGLGQVGASIGLALKKRGADVHLVGHDKSTGSAKTAQKIGAVDTFKYNLPDSVRDAQIVVLALPFAEVRAVLDLIAPDLQEGTLVLDTALSKGTVASWAEELLPKGRFYVGLTPAIHPQYLNITELGIDAAHADLFERSVIVVTSPMGTPGNVFNLTTDFITILGAMPLVMDTVEADGLSGKVHVLPQLAAAALLDATIDQPGWQEATKLTGRPYAAVTAAFANHDDAASLREFALENRENTVRLLNEFITSLINIRDEIEDNDRVALTKRLDNAWEGRIRWDGERYSTGWLDKDGEKVDVPTFGKQMNQMFFGQSARDRAKNKK